MSKETSDVLKWEVKCMTVHIFGLKHLTEADFEWAKTDGDFYCDILPMDLHFIGNRNSYKSEN